jgi:hypothetical protein
VALLEQDPGQQHHALVTPVVITVRWASGATAARRPR